MSEHDEGQDLDEKLEKLRDLPEVPLPPMLSASVRRNARVAFLESGAPSAAGSEREGDVLVAVWTHTVLPLLLLLMGAAYIVSSIASLGRVYIGN
ncbi:hypothetical protein LVJ94_23245 [Pendulispora rubella]|uniref:Uncharacterized protein n=1 Tax=Pendulispora rubella TaxID=2741070 RepID=A0ABZ2LGR3_9BACT